MLLRKSLLLLLLLLLMELLEMLLLLKDLQIDRWLTEGSVSC